MTRVSEIMTRDPVTVDVDATLRQAVEVLQSAGVSGAPVLSRGHLIGVISATDILELESTSPGVPPERGEMLDWGEPDVPVEGEDEEEFPAAFFVDRWADSEADVWNRISETESPEWDRLEEHTVGEVMTRKVVTVPLDSSVAEAARRMLDLRLHRVLVVDKDVLVGIVSAFDILRQVAASAGPTPGAKATPLGFEVSMSHGFSGAIDRVTEALRAEGFGVLTRIDLDRAFEEKLGVRFDRFAILGACNPNLAHQAMTRDREVGLFLPCNVTVEESAGGSLVRLVDPRVMMGIGRFGDDAVVRGIAEEARMRFGRVAAALAEGVPAVG